MNKKQKKILYRILLTASMVIFAEAFPFTLLYRSILYLSAYLIIGFDILKKAFWGILNRRVFDENFLMAIATIGAIALAFRNKNGDFFEAVSVMLFYQIGELFQSYAVGKSRRSISALMDIRPDHANIEINGVRKMVCPGEVKVGTTITVYPGERIPIDGIVLNGRTSIDTSSLTGESLPLDAAPGTPVYSGTINLSGAIGVRTTKTFDSSTASKILSLVEDSATNKAVVEAFISKFARIYTPTICLLAITLAVLPPFVCLAFNLSPQWSIWLYRALTFLVISCPCALVISVPLTFFAGIGGASRKGILIKGASYLESLSKIRTVVFDKTGTLTKGTFEVVGISPDGIESEKLLEYSAHAESQFSHPISKSLLRAYGKKVDESRVASAENISGKGVSAKVDGKSIALGNLAFMQDLNISAPPTTKIGTVIHIAIDGNYKGNIVISDKIKADSHNAILQLKKIGVNRIVMLTGDNSEVAKATAQALEIDEFSSNLMPQDKVELVERLLEDSNKKSTLAFVGDGINDAPVLSRADVGIAMGGIGSDAAIEAADVVLMEDNPQNIPKAIHLSKRCMRIVRQNISFALGIKFVCLCLGALGIGGMGLAIFADVGVMVIAVLNAIRALK